MHHLKTLGPLLALIALLGAIVGASVFSAMTLLRDSSPASSQGTGAEGALPENIPAEFGRIYEVWDVLQNEHYLGDSLDPDALSQAAVRGMLDSIDDPYAAFLSPDEYAIESEDIHGAFEGIGANVGMRDGVVTIIAPLPDSPAEKAGIQPGDIIQEIDGEDVTGWSLLEVVTKIRGPSGELVRLGIKRQGDVLMVLSIVRDRVETKSVNLSFLAGNIAHLKIGSFTESTDPETGDALKMVVDAKARGLIIDVRNNPGGLLQAVVDVASRFIDGGLILYQVDGDGQRQDWEADDGTSTEGIPLVMLINEGSASGSEVLAGALRDREQVLLIGAKTFGKGSVNILRGLSDGSGLYFTTARWYTPEGALLEGEGIHPDVEILQDHGSRIIFNWVQP